MGAAAILPRRGMVETNLVDTQWRAVILSRAGLGTPDVRRLFSMVYIVFADMQPVAAILYFPDFSSLPEYAPACERVSSRSPNLKARIRSGRRVSCAFAGDGS